MRYFRRFWKMMQWVTLILGRRGLVVSLLLVVCGCEHSELWRHRQETFEIRARLPEKERHLNQLQARRATLEQQGLSLQSNIQSQQTTLEELSQQSQSLETQLNEAQARNKKLNFDINAMQARSRYLKQQIATLQKDQAKQLEASDQAELAKSQRIEQLKKELDTLLKIIAYQ